uniref:VRK serine/threonine kinase 3 n=1 Tax=Xiphophorus couchianus TaxID=32473 RepID=A0A3B5M591_9TELE
MPFHFCPQCGTKLQPDFRFCPSCGEKLPSSPDEAGLQISAVSLKDETKTAVTNSSPPSTLTCEPTVVFKNDKTKGTKNSRKMVRNGREIIVLAALSDPEDEEERMRVCGPEPEHSCKSKKAKHASSPEPLPEGEQLTDQSGKTWKLIKLIDQNMTELLYEAAQPNSEEADHILKLGAKDGKIFNEQNFLQRAAKSASVEKWIKQNKLDFLGIPVCVGFGLHADLYRFLIFPDMGCSLQSVLEEENELLSEKAVLQLACRILDVLEFIHSKEYVHADVNAENIYVKPGQKSQVKQSFCGKRYTQKTPSRRSDLQSLGYCMLLWHTGTLPWAELHHPKLVTAEKQRYMKDVRALLRDCFGKREVSGAFQGFLTAVMSLQYTEEPNYSMLKTGLSAALQQLGGSKQFLVCR